MSPVKQELLTIPQHTNSLSVFIGVRVARSLVFRVMFCRSMFVLLTFFVWPLYCTDSDYSFGIFKIILLHVLLYNGVLTVATPPMLLVKYGVMNMNNTKC